MGSKVDRRAAIQQELAERNRALEETRVAEFDKIDWRRASCLSDAIRRSVVRLGGTPLTSDATTLCDLIDFKFLPRASTGKFWDGWEEEFSGVNPNTTFPVGADGHYFLFIANNPCDPSDPLLFTVDHEEVDEPPYRPSDATVGRFFATLERASP